MFNKNFTLSKIVDQKLERAGKLLEAELLNHKATIHTLVLQGKTFDKRSLGKYSEGYKKLRMASGRSGSPVDLTVTGSMLQSMDVKIESIKNKFVTGIIYFRDVKSIAPKAFGGRAASAPDKAKWITEKGRKFFGITTKQTKEMIARIKNKL